MPRIDWIAVPDGGLRNAAGELETLRLGLVPAFVLEVADTWDRVGHRLGTWPTFFRGLEPSFEVRLHRDATDEGRVVATVTATDAMTVDERALEAASKIWGTVMFGTPPSISPEESGVRRVQQKAKEERRRNAEKPQPPEGSGTTNAEIGAPGIVSGPVSRLDEASTSATARPERVPPPAAEIVDPRSRRAIDASKPQLLKKLFDFADAHRNNQMSTLLDQMRGGLATIPGPHNLGAALVFVPPPPPPPAELESARDGFRSAFREHHRTESEAKAWIAKAIVEPLARVHTVNWPTGHGTAVDYLMQDDPPADLLVFVPQPYQDLHRYVRRVGRCDWSRVLTDKAIEMLLLAAMGLEGLATVRQDYPWLRFMLDHPIESANVVPRAGTISDRLGQLRSNAGLMPLFGLVVNLRLRRDVMGDVKGGIVSVRPVWRKKDATSPFLESYRRTAFILGTDRFCPASSADPNAELQVDGLIRMWNPASGQPLFELRTSDFNTQMVAAAETFSAAEGRARTGEADAFSGLSVKANTTAGLVLCRTAESVNAKVTQSDAQKKKDPLAILYAQDLTIGYRVDVRARHGGKTRWSALCEAVIKYAYSESSTSRPFDLPDGLEERRLEEGYIRPAARVTSDDPNTLLAAEELCVWRGWNLTLPHESSHELYDGTTFGLSEEAGIVHAMPGDGLPRLKLSYEKRPGSMVPLRIGDSHVFGLRAALLNGGGVSLEEAIPRYENEELHNGLLIGLGVSDEDKTGRLVPQERAFARNEKLRPPELHLAAPLDHVAYPGEQVDRMVVRTGETVAHGESPPARFVVPPREPQEIVALTGVLDASYERGLAGAFAGQVILTDDGQFISVDAYGKRHEDRASGCASRVHDQQTIIVFDQGAKPPAHPYLPDPWVHGAAFAILDDHRPCWGDPIEPITFYADGRPWPQARPICLKLKREAAESCSPRRCAFTVVAAGGFFDTPYDTLEIALPPAEQVRLAVWSVPPNPDKHGSLLKEWDHFAPSHKFKFTSSEECRDLGFGSQEDLCRHVLLHMSDRECNPPRFIELVHAVQKPLGFPAFGRGFRMTREKAGDMKAFFEGELEVHRLSTGSVACSGRWDDIVDKPGETGPREDHRASEMFTVSQIAPRAARQETIDLSSDDQGNDRAVTFDFQDTRRHDLKLSLKSRSRFEDYFPLLGQGSDAFCVSGTREITVSVPSSTRPAAPKISHIVPLMDWEESSGRDHSSVKTGGGGVRVWLDRPWFSSGNEEMLAVVCWPGTAMGDSATPWQGVHDSLAKLLKLKAGTTPGSTLKPDLPTEAEPYVTRIGQDPAWPGGRFMEVLPQSAFPGAMYRSNLKCLEIQAAKSDETISVAAYAVGRKHYDEVRQQYYCDIDIDLDVLNRDTTDPGRWPFIRFAFARYQPASVPGVELSAISVTDMAQLAPGRTAVVNYDPKDPSKAILTVSGFGSADLEANAAWFRFKRHKEEAQNFLTRRQRALRIQVEVRKLLRGFREDNPAGWVSVPYHEADLMNEGLRITRVGTSIEASILLRLPEAEEGDSFALVVREEEIHARSSASLKDPPKDWGARRIYSQQLKLFTKAHASFFDRLMS